ncbi:MAG: hypothetical protein P8J50_07570 [Acidimicrobiales bacterium]|jgi:hypothetical protein|nr:hypothetical protein [Acidimicrobiales bacterium]
MAGRSARAGHVGVAVLALSFAVIKTLPIAATLTVGRADALTPWSNAIVTDPTDLLAVPAVLFAAPSIRRPVVW